DDTRSILSHNDSPDLVFRWSVNPYRGCFHACAYCYARPTHEYLGFGAGTDFESKLVVKRDAAALLREAFLKPSWKGELVVFPGIPFADDLMARKVEPQAPSVTKRLATLKTIAEAGIPAGISIAPVIPGLNDDHMFEILQKARDAGARTAFYSLLRLPGSVEPVFLERMAAAFPDRIKKITHRLQEVRGGVLNTSRFFDRYRGQGPYGEMLDQLFLTAKRKAGFPEEQDPPLLSTFHRPQPQQIDLFAY